MRIILQRVKSAAVRVDGQRLAEIASGMLILVGVQKGDSEDQAVKAAEKLAHLRIFEDAEGRMNRSIGEVDGSLLVVPQFTLAGSLAKGRRPSFDGAAPPAVAEPLVEHLIERLRDLDVRVATGRFGARMEVELINDGPVTFVLEIPPDPEQDGEARGQSTRSRSAPA
jgi:D-tyrosyl-tRNA(Tyr) deacylase